MPRATSRRYAQAAFAIATDRDQLDLWAQDVRRAADVLADDDVMAFMASPSVPLAVRLNGIDTLMQDLDPTVKNLWSLLVSNGDVEQSAEIASAFERLADERNGVGRAQVSTAVPLVNAQRNALVEKLQEVTGLNTIEVTETVDDSMLGGIVARIGDRLIDGSARSRLRSLRNALARRPVGI